MRGHMRTHASEAGFSLVELMAATTISLIVIGTAMMAFKDGVAMNDTASNLADASQNLRGGTNFLVRDLVSAGRVIPTGGIPIPSGAGAGQIKRPSPPGLQYYFDNTTATTLTAITTGAGLGPSVDSQVTDMVTILTIDPILDACRGGALFLNPALKSNGTTTNPAPVLAQDGSSFNVGTNVACISPIAGTWIVGDATGGQSPIKKGDLLMFTDPLGNSALQTVTKTDATNVYFETNSNDSFGLNQRNVTAGSITQILGTAPNKLVGLRVQRVLMWTYFVDASSTGGQPHLMRQLNFFSPQALAGVVEDLELSYDLVDGTNNPVDVKTLPYTYTDGTVYTASQIRKVNVHVGVRSEAMSTKQHDYLRNHLSTVVSLRSLAYVDRYK
jgi:Prokaryotic N-terminal methylation motif